jgi:hypothetical protein
VTRLCWRPLTGIDADPGNSRAGRLLRKVGEKEERPP